MRASPWAEALVARRLPGRRRECLLVMATLVQALHRLAEVRPAYAAAALGLFLFSLWIGAARWQRLLAAMGCRVRVMRLLLVNLVGICANNLTLNSRVAGEGARLAALHATDGVGADRLAISTVYERLADVIGGALVVLIALPAAWSIGASLRLPRSAWVAAGAAMAAAALAAAIRRRLPPQVIGGWQAARSRYAVGRSTLAFTTLCSVTISVQDPLRLMAGAAAFGVKLSLSQAALVSAASMFAGGLPAVGALGAIEGALVAALVALKVKVATAMAIAALERAISLVFSTAAGAAAALALGGRALWRRVRGGPAADGDRAAPSSDVSPATVLVVCGNGPDPITLRKIEALSATGAYDVHLAYWRDPASRRAYPFTAAIPASSMHAIDLPDPNGPPLRGFILLVRFHARVWALARRIRPDVLHAVNFDMLIGAWLLAVGRKRRTLVYDLLDTHDSLRRPATVVLQRLVLRRVDRLYTTSPRFVSGFLRPLRLIGAGQKPVVIPNAPWAATFDHMARRDGGPFVVGYIGSFRCEPAIVWLCESVAGLRRSGLDVEILFAGTGEARPTVEAMARRHPFVHHEGAYEYARDIRRLYERVDLVFAIYDVSWDKRTHLPCRFSDAILAGRPMVAAAGTYLGDLVSRHRLGYAVDLNDPGALEAALRDAVARRTEWCDPSRIPPRLRAEHTFEHYVTALRTSYAEACARRRTRPMRAGRSELVSLGLYRAGHGSLHGTGARARAASSRNATTSTLT